MWGLLYIEFVCAVPTFLMECLSGSRRLFTGVESEEAMNGASVKRELNVVAPALALHVECFYGIFYTGN